MKNKIKQILKKIICSYSPNFVCPQNKEVSISIPEITPLNTNATQGNYKRLNLLVPSVNKKDVFGGVSTAINLFEELLKLLPGDFLARVIVTDTSLKDPVSNFKNYSFAVLGKEGNAKLQVVTCNDRYGKKLSVIKSDIFLTTAWWTTHIAQNIINDQKSYFGAALPFLYLIQDYEPCFYNWSARYALAEATYRTKNKTIAIINSNELSNYLLDNNYSFYKQFYFLPKMNHNLKRFWEKRGGVNKKKQLIIYGRPSVDRNLFPIVVEALKIWVWKQADISEWTILSLGEKHDDMELGSGATLISKGKLTLEEYAETLLESSLGVSLMLSPHPSYPPLEMAYFGVITVTNTYPNKNLDSMHENIKSIDVCCPELVVEKLLKGASELSLDINAGKNSEIKEKSYISNAPSYPFIDILSDEISSSCR